MIALLAATALAQPAPPPEAPTVVPSEQQADAFPPDDPVVREVRARPRFVGDGELTIDEIVEADLFGAGGEVRVLAAVGDNAFLTGGDVSVEAPIDGDLFVAGGTLTVDAAVDGDVYVVGGEVELSSAAAVAGHVFALGGDVTIDGPVAGSLQVGSGHVVLGGPIGGDVQLEAGEIVVGRGASIGGDLTYTTPTRLPELEAIVAGSVEHVQTPDEDEQAAALVEEQEEEESSWLSQLVWWSAFRVWGYGTKLVVGVLLLLLGGAALGRTARKVVERPAESLGLGFVVVSVLPVVSTIALVTVVPFPLGLLGWSMLVIGLYVGQLFAAQALGDLILKRFRPDAWGSPVLSLAVGLVPLVLLTSLPWLGKLVWLVATLFGLGALWLQVREIGRS
jgi:cytoskeletal protein CcmA (bactofilin family)